MNLKSLSEAINREWASPTIFHPLKNEEVKHLDAGGGVGLIAHHVCDTVGMHDASNFGFEVWHFVDWDKARNIR